MEMEVVVEVEEVMALLGRTVKERTLVMNVRMHDVT